MEVTGLGLKGRSYKVMVRVNDEDGWTSNLLRFATRDAARVYGRGLAARWGQVEGWRVDPSDDDVTERPSNAIEGAGLDLENGQ